VKLGKRSLERLSTIKPKLREVVLKACETMPFDITVIEGIRTLERQKELLKQGATKTLNSKHLTGDAVDLAPYPIDWNDTDRFKIMANHVLDAAKKMKVNVTWGGNWKTFIDMPHFQLD
ncbi:UNVERIFIED_CONTAM: M15 family metallopeptidase, partial [Kocuria sp. CPCC 205274]